jgi:protein-tyrosine-phosphatase
MAEALLNHRGEGRFRAWSAGSQPKGAVHPHTRAVLERARVPAPEARSKSWNEFSGPGAPRLDFVFTVCGNAANEVCPVWQGGPLTAHWGVDDPAAAEGTEEERRRAFDRALRELDARIERFTKLPLESLDPAARQQRIREIGRQPS